MGEEQISISSVSNTQTAKASVEEQEHYDNELDLHKDPLKAFYLNGGGVFYNIHELIQALHDMPEATFIYHVNAEKNDFANWMRDVFKMPKLAGRMIYFKNKMALKQFLKTYFESGIAGVDASASTARGAGRPAADATGKKEIDDPLQKILFKSKHPDDERSEGRTQENKIPGGMTPENKPTDNAEAQDQKKKDVPYFKPMTEDEAIEVLRNMKEKEKGKYKSTIDPATSERIDRIKDRINALKREMTDRRKEGKDLFFSTLLFKKIEPQIKIALATNEEKDMKKLDMYIDDVEKTFREEMTQPILDIKAEIRMIAEAKDREYDAMEKAKEEAKRKSAAQTTTHTAAQTSGTQAGT